MKTVNEIVTFIEERISNIYFRPLMYGGTATGVDTILHYYHVLWADIYGKVELYYSIRDKLFEDLKCGSATFSTHYKIDNPKATENDASFFAIDQWMKISKELEVPVPLKRLHAEFISHSNSSNINKKLLAEPWLSADA